MNLAQANEQIFNLLAERARALGLRFEVSGSLNNMGGVSHFGWARIFLCDAEDPAQVRGELTLADMPGCCGVFVATGLRVAEGLRRSGIGTLLLDAADIVVTSGRVGCLIGTAANAHDAVAELLTKRGWERSMRFVNGRTDNEISMWHKHYTYEG